MNRWKVTDADILDTWYRDEDALYQITIDETDGAQVIASVRDIIGAKQLYGWYCGIKCACSRQHFKRSRADYLICNPIDFCDSFLTTTSWFEPVLFMATIGVAILLNRGTNLMFGTISFVTNAAGSILQLAVSMDYSIFLLHRFAENRGGRGRMFSEPWQVR